jgi:hypothetical protein
VKPGELPNACEAVLTIEQAQIDAQGLLGAIDEDCMRDVIRAIGFVIQSDCEPV